VSARYLVRFDDICPTMNWLTWEAVEEVLRASGIRPILAVVPDNRDPDLQAGPPARDFWDRVRAWQRSGWTIAMHGYQHAYVTRQAGLIGLNCYSEFAGLPSQQQQSKLTAALAIFLREGVRPTVWVAPAHSFDAITTVLLRDLGIHFISDGLFFAPRVDAGGSTWIPQQLWKFRPMPFGLWTVCLHTNKWTRAELAQFGHDIGRYRTQISSFQEVATAYEGCPVTWLDALVARMMCTAVHVKRQVRQWRGRHHA
jgi:hypothetical protein